MFRYSFKILPDRLKLIRLYPCGSLGQSISFVFGARVGHFAATPQSDVVGIWSHDLGVMATLSVRQKMPFLGAFITLRSQFHLHHRSQRALTKIVSKITPNLGLVVWRVKLTQPSASAWKRTGCYTEIPANCYRTTEIGSCPHANYIKANRLLHKNSDRISAGLLNWCSVAYVTGCLIATTADNDRKTNIVNWPHTLYGLAVLLSCLGVKSQLTYTAVFPSPPPVTLIKEPVRKVREDN